MQRWTYNNTIEEIHTLYNFLVSTVAMWTSTCRGENVTGEDHLYWTEMCRCLSREFTCRPMVKEIPRQGIVFAFPNTQFPEKEGKHSNLARFAHGIRTWLPTVSSETRLTSHSQCPSTSIQTYYTSWRVNEPCHWTLPRHHQPCWKSQCIQSNGTQKNRRLFRDHSPPQLHSYLSVPSQVISKRFCHSLPQTITTTTIHTGHTYPNGFTQSEHTKAHTNKLSVSDVN